MVILVVQQNATGPWLQGEKYLAQEYPQAEPILVSNPTDLDQRLDQEDIELALVDGRVSWMPSKEVLRHIHKRRPGLATVLLAPDGSEAQAALEAELRASRALVDSLLNTPTDLILVIDPQHRVITANQAFYNLSGKRADEVVGRNLFEILPPDLAQRRDAAVQHVFDSGETLRFEDRGVEAWLDITIYPIRDAQGQVTQVVAYAHDFTERKELEDGLRQSQKVIDALLDVPTDLIVLLDHDGRFVRVNQTFCKRFATSPENVLGRTLYDILPPDLARQRLEMVQRVFETGVKERHEEKGVTGWYDYAVYPILNDQNQVIYVAVIAHDINERKHLEEILRQDQRTMLAMANAPNDIFLLLNRCGIILNTNEVVARSLGRRIEDLIGFCLWDFLPKPVADFRRAVFDRVLQTGQAERLEDQGRLGVYDSRVIPVTNDQGQVVQVAILARDITERKQTEQALKESEQRYHALVETSPDGIFYFDLDKELNGRLRIVSPQFAAMFGYASAQEILELDLSENDLVAEQDHPWLRKIIQTSLQQGFVRDVVLTGRRKNGTLFQVETNGTIVNNDNGEPMGFLGICRDVTERISLQQELIKAHESLEHRVVERTAELQAAVRQLRNEVNLRKQAEEQWQRQAQRAEALAQVALRANAQLEMKAVLYAICSEIIRVLPYSISAINLYHEQNDAFIIEAHASLVQANIERVPPIPRALIQDYLIRHGPVIIIPDVQALTSGSETMTVALPNVRTVISIPMVSDRDLIGILSVASVEEMFIPNDEEIALLTAISNQATLAISNARLFKRISEGQAQLKTLTERLVRVQEEEIRKVARELHDEIGQTLTSLSLNLEIISRSIEAGQEKEVVLEGMTGIRMQVKQLLEQVRDLSLNLLPSMLEDLGLLPALLDQFQRYTAQTGIQVNLAHHGLERRFPAHLETAAYRIIQEALTNVARYARVQQVEVRLWVTPSMLGLQVEDQGVGFDLQQVESAHRSSGIAGMRERAAGCGGKLEIETLPGQGTCVTVEFPLEHRQPKQRTL